MLLKKAANVIHDSLLHSSSEETPWPPTPQQILESEKGPTSELDFVDNIPEGQLDNNGEVVVPKTKKIKVQQHVLNKNRYCLKLNRPRIKSYHQ